MDKPLVSVIMPAYNAELYIGEAIKSVINQTFQNWELIIVDDGSTDTTAEIIVEYKRNEKRIKSLFQKNGKQGKARNLGLAYSNGKYIAFLDADDLWVENKLTIQINYLLVNQEIDLIFSSGYFLDRGNSTDFDVVVKPIWNINDLPLFVNKNQVPIVSVIVKKICLDNVSNFIEDLDIQNVEDYHLWLKLLSKQFILASIPDKLFYYRIHSDQNTFNEHLTFYPIVKMFRLLYHENKILNCEKILVTRLKWMLFDSKANEEATQLIVIILKSVNKYLAQLIAFVLKMPSCKIRTKMIFKIASWI